MESKSSDEIETIYDMNKRVNEPQLIDESTSEELPINLYRIIENLESFNGSKRNAYDLLACVYYVLMIEVGFIPRGYQQQMFDSGLTSIDFSRKRLAYFDFLPDGWKKPSPRGHYFSFVLGAFADKTCTMICYKMANLSVINLIINDTVTISHTLHSTNYITNEEWDSVSGKFKNLNLLSQEFKNHLANVAKYHILLDYNIIPITLDVLPPEVLSRILMDISVKDFLAVKLTSHVLKENANYYNTPIWKYYFQRDFPSDVEKFSDTTQTWFEKYRIRYRRRQTDRRITPFPFGFRLSEIV